MCCLPSVVSTRSTTRPIGGLPGILPSVGNNVAGDPWNLAPTAARRRRSGRGAPGRSGASWTTEATNFAVRAPEATAVWVCLFDDDERETRHRADRASRSASGTARSRASRRARATATAPTGPGSPSWGCGSTRDKLLLDPYARAVSGELTHDPAIFGYDVGRSPARRSRRDSAPYVPKSVVVARPGFDWGDDRRPLHALARHRDLRAARQGHDRAARPGARAPARHLRRAGDARRSPTTCATSA